MLNGRVSDTAWGHTLRLLGLGASDESERRTLGRSATQFISADPWTQPEDLRLSSRIEIVECVSSDVLIVCCHGATTGHYGAQVWKRGKARVRGSCAITRAEIRRGDDVFRPTSRGRTPINIDWVILASAISVDAIVEKLEASGA